MKKIGLVTEGKTDLWVIENVLTGFFNDMDLFITDLFPDRNDDEVLGGWERVFDYCGSEKFRNAFRRHDFIVVQIDTDICEHPNFGVNKLDEGKQLTTKELIERVEQKLISIIGEEFFDTYKQHLVFAICVHSMECWLLPIYCRGKHVSKTTGCLDTLNRSLAKSNRPTIGTSKDPGLYDHISKRYRKRTELMKLHKLNPSLEVFVTNLISWLSRIND